MPTLNARLRPITVRGLHQTDEFLSRAEDFGGVARPAGEAVVGKEEQSDDAPGHK